MTTVLTASQTSDQQATFHAPRIECGGSEELCDNQSNVQLSDPEGDNDNDLAG